MFKAMFNLEFCNRITELYGKITVGITFGEYIKKNNNFQIMKKSFWVGPFFRVGRVRGNKKYFSFGLVPQRFYGDMVGLGWVEILNPSTQVPIACGYRILGIYILMNIISSASLSFCTRVHVKGTKL